MKTLKRIAALICAAAVTAAAYAPIGAVASPFQEIIDELSEFDDGVTVILNGEYVNFDVNPQILGGRTMVPMRAIFEALGADIDWNDAAKTVTATRGNDVISLTIHSPVMTVNGTEKTLDKEPMIIKDRTLVPLRAISEALGSTVDWDGATRTVTITDNGVVNTVAAWKTAYSDFLNTQDGKFELIYMTNDDIPEIIITEKQVITSSGAKIYTYVNGSVKQVNWEDAVTSRRIGGTIHYKEKSGLFYTMSVNMGNGENNILSLNNDGTVSVEHKFEIINDVTASGTKTYHKWNGDAISGETLDSEWNRMTSDYKEAGFSTSIPINSANIKSALGL